MPKINLHAHTNLSDGREDVIDMARTAYELGHSAFVLTDHDYSEGSFRVGESILWLIRDHNLAPLPIIHGSEISTPWGECLLFGQEALYAYFGLKVSGTAGIKPRLRKLPKVADMVDLLDDTKHDPTEWLKEFEKRVKNTVHALVLCHPTQYDNRRLRHRGGDLVHIIEAEKTLLKMLHGIEVKNQVQEYEVDWLFEYLRPDCKRLVNSDAHSLECLAICCNETEETILDENQLIRWLGGNIS